METSFTPISALIGGIMIGLGSAILLYGNGRVAGISGILGGLLSHKEDAGWRLSFLAGLLAAGFGWTILYTPLAPTMVAGSFALVVAGLLVGVGTRLGSGCTSGHGVCGLARFSLRSLVATLTFMITGGVTVYIVRHLMGG